MRDSKDEHRYDDIIHLPHPTSAKYPRMSMMDRAAQFSPFAALTGYEAAIRETARVTEPKIELDEYEKEVLNERLQMLQETMTQHPTISLTYFLPDERKDGGSYVSLTGAVKHIDNDKHTQQEKETNL